jgi:transcription-repair coupling factor (superfamily II helicase)
MMKDLLKEIEGSEQYERIVSALGQGERISVGGLWGSFGSHLVALLAKGTRRLCLLVTPTLEEAQEAAEDISLFLPGQVVLFPPWESLPVAGRYAAEEREEALPNVHIYRERLSVLHLLLADKSGSNSRPQRSKDATVIVTPINALLQPVLSPEVLAENTILLKVGSTSRMDSLVEWLVDRDFEAVDMVEYPGEFSRRGGILDVYLYSSEWPLRVEFFGDRIESIREFDIDSQRSEVTREETKLTAVPRERILRMEESALVNFLALLPHESPSGKSRYGDGAWIFLKETLQLEERANKFFSRLAEPEGYFSFAFVLKQIRQFPHANLSIIPGELTREAVRFNVAPLPSFDRDQRSWQEELSALLEEHKEVIIFCNNEAEEMRLGELLKGAPVGRPSGAEDGRRPPKARKGLASRIRLEIGRLNHGYRLLDAGVAIVAHNEIFSRYRERRELRPYRHTRPIESFLDLERGDFVVHITHGIGRFLGLRQIVREGRRQEYLEIEYAGRVKVLVPVNQSKEVQKYVGGPKRPSLDKVGGKFWQRRKEKVKEAVRELAAELIQLAAVRQTRPGIAYGADDDWQREFEAEFPYEETEDQLKVMAEIKKDMQEPQPMDRLICGDVGYGKTELAVRAAFKAATSGKQAAVLVPTTILAEQHFRTFSERMADYPIMIEVLSRFKTKGEQRQILERLEAGEVDIVIGTHRLLQKDVRFNDLGLVIIDEEQRFGVEHKEALKRLRRTVDVLTLTATPIPRTLHMSLLGIRDISVLETPPPDRLSIETQVSHFQPQRIREAILRELNREGQVYFVHNRVHSIEKVKERLEDIVPEARVATAHGQMHSEDLESRMLDFVSGKTDVLVSTTIIESGLDIPNVNTIFIHQADMFGLADLHQLRGRVGRYKHRAYAYLLLPERRPVTPTAQKRLKAIQDFAELGAGFKIAMRDLEIRGAGNLLGREQSGHIAAVGYELYTRLLEEMVRQLKKEPPREEENAHIDIGLEAFLPEDYVPHQGQRLEIYSRLARAKEVKEPLQVEREVRDRFGALPEEARNLIELSRLAVAARDCGLSSIITVEDGLLFEIRNKDKALKTLAGLRNKIRIIDEGSIFLPLEKSKQAPQALFKWLKKILLKGK